MPDLLNTEDRLGPSDTFVRRHIGPSPTDIQAMLACVGAETLESLVDATIPASIRTKTPLAIGPPRGEHAFLEELRTVSRKNAVWRSLIGMGYHDCLVPGVIQRNVFENPGWYTQYTPYQAEIAQGRLEALLNFQTMVADLTGLPLANASMLDEATAAAEAMAMCRRAVDGDQPVFYVAEDCHPQTIAVVRTRARPLGVEVQVCKAEAIDFSNREGFGLLLQYPATDGRVVDYTEIVQRAHDAGLLVVLATDLLALTLLKPPGELGADIAVGSAQRFGVPLGYGGPHAAFMATRDEYKRQIPGRLIGVSKDVHGRPAYRLAIQTREQHIRREKATSNICTAQVLLAVMNGLYGAYHGPDGLRRIAERTHALTCALAVGLRRQGHDTGDCAFFDTLRVRPNGLSVEEVIAAAARHHINLRNYEDGSVGVALDEKTDRDEIARLLDAFNGGKPSGLKLDDLMASAETEYGEGLARQTPYLEHPAFNAYHSETEMLRYLHRLQQRDLSLTTSMIPLGSCTMKLNGTSEMVPVTWPEFSSIHPFAPESQTRGYTELCERLEAWLSELSGFAATSLQPNSGAQGEYAGLLVIKAYQEQRGEGHRNVCLIPVSAHGTNAASAVMAGMRVVVVNCDENGNVDVADLKAKAERHREHLSSLMITYPSTAGVFEERIREVCSVIHEHGGQVYMDGANMNAQLGLCKPGEIGADVCHLNLHKTFCIPHGGGGPGMGPICVASHLAPHLPSHPVAGSADEKAIGPVSAAPFGSASILPISYVYIGLMGGVGLTRASQVAILNANYMAARLAPHYDVLFTGANGRVAHEFILDCRHFDKSAGIKIDDIAKRLMDYGFHAPTMSWPVAGTLMVEPTDSESKAERERFCDAMIAIREEIKAIEEGRADRADNVLKGAPHTAEAVASDDWPHAYTRREAAFPAPWVSEHKFWPAVGRVDNVFGDRNLICSCPPVTAFAESDDG